MAHIYLIEGPVGAGKSTYGRALAAQHGAVRFTLDAWFATLFRADRPESGVLEWYVERKERCVRQIWQVAAEVLDAGKDVVLELGLIQRRDRERLYALADAAGRTLAVHVLDAPRAVRWERVAARNAERGETFSMEVPEPFFHFASDLWEAPGEDECAQREVRFVTDGN